MQVAFAARLPPPSETLVAPGAAETAPPPQVVEAFGVEATTSPFGSVSVNAMLVSATAPAAVLGMVIVSVDVPPVVNVAGENDFEITDGVLIVRSAVVGALFVTFCVSVSALAGIVLVYVPDTMPVTDVMMVHVAAAARLPPLKATVVLPAVAVTVPPQVVDAFGDDATVTPLGNVSVNAMPLRATAPASVFGMVIVNVEALPELIDVGENAFVIPSGAVIVRSAVVGVVLVTFCVSLSALAGMVLV